MLFLLGLTIDCLSCVFFPIIVMIWSSTGGIEFFPVDLFRVDCLVLDNLSGMLTGQQCDMLTIDCLSLLW